MDNIGYLSLALAARESRAADVSANNMANANTAGFRGSRVSFEEMVVSTGSGDAMDKMSYSIDKGTYNDLTEGGLTMTGGDLDVAIQGDAFFAFQRTDGRIAIGREGNLAMTPQGDLVTASGHSILNVGGAPINIPPDAGGVSIAADGTISTALGEVIDQIGTFAEPEADRWLRLDGSMMVPHEGDPALAPALDARVAQGFVEKSNIDPIREMTEMITLQRSYERAMNVANSADELRKTALQRMGRPA